MATLTRQKSSATYKDYVQFLETYKTGNKDDQRSDHSEDSGISIKNFSKSSSSNTSSTSINSDVVDYGKSVCVPYKTFQENVQNKKFAPVKPKMKEEKPTMKRSEIFIEIQPSNHVSQVSKIFEEPKAEPHRTSINNKKKIGAKIDLFERQKSVDNKPMIGRKPSFNKNESSKNVSVLKIQLNNSKPETKIEQKKPSKMDSLPPIPKIEPKLDSAPSKSTDPIQINNSLSSDQSIVPPPPPPPPMISIQPARLRATLKTNPQTKISVESSGEKINRLDKNDPAVRKLVYGTLRGLYGAYHDKANIMVSTLPRNMVKKDNGIQRIINEMATNGELGKLSGRSNPKQEN